MSIQESSIPTEMKYRILLSIGKEQELHSMLRKAIQTYMKELNCTAGMVLKLNSSNEDEYVVENIFSLPTTLNIKSYYKELFRIFPDSYNGIELAGFRRNLPFSGQISSGNFYQILGLGKFGFLMLIRQTSAFDPKLSESLSDVNEHLGNTCFNFSRQDMLEESGKHYRDLSEYLPEFIFETDLEGQVLYANRFACTKLGFNKSEFGNGLIFSELVLPEFREKALSHIRHSSEDKDPEAAELKLISRTGKTLTALMYSSAFKRYSRNVGYRIVVVDISERIVNDLRIKEYTERFELAVQGSNAGIWDWNLETGEVFYSDRWCQMLEYSLREIKPHITSWKELVHPADMPEVEESILNHREGKTPLYKNEYRMRTKSGKWLWIQNTGKIIKWDQDGVALRAVGTHTDISEKKHNEKALQQSLHQHELLSDIALELNSPGDFKKRINSILMKIGKYTNVSRTYIFENDPAGTSTSNTFEWCNEGISDQIQDLQGVEYTLIPSWKEILENEGMIYSENISSLPEDIRNILEPQDIKSIIVFPIMISETFFGFIGFDDCEGQKHWIKRELELLRTVSGIIANSYERKLMEQSILDERDRANLANKAKSEFLSNMSHEIRTPMNAIIGFSESLYHKTESPQHRSMIKSIMKSGNMLMSLLNDILDLSKIEAGKMVLEPRQVDLDNIIQEIVLLFRTKTQKKGIALTRTISGNMPGHLYLDEIRIKQVLFNLVGNAIKFTENGYVNIEASFIPESNDSGKLALIVEDTGIGISPDQQASIFEAFRQQSGQSPKFEGVGLGLAITKRLIEKMDGHIEVHSEPDKGSRFSMMIPGVKLSDSNNRELQDSREILDLQFQQADIMVVDDVYPNISVIKSLLSDSGLEVYSATDPHDALETIKDIKPSLILMDIRIPGMDGFELTRIIRQMPGFEKTPVIAFTASVFDSGNILSSKLFDEVLFKPINMQRLMECLAKHLEHKVVKSVHTEEEKPWQNITVPEELMNQLPQIHQMLHEDLLPEWEKIENSLVLFKMKEFADMLQKRASHLGFLELEAYGLDISRAIEMVDLDLIRQTLKQFPLIVERIDNQKSALK